MKYIFKVDLTKKEKKYVWDRFRSLYPDTTIKTLHVYRDNGIYRLIDKDNEITYLLNQRRTKILSDTEIHIKCTSDEKTKLDQYCYKNNISMSSICRIAVNEKLGIKIFQ